MRRLLALCLILALPTNLHAQVRSVEVRSPRAFGYFVGDIVRSQIDLLVDDGFSVESASLPKPGPVAYWLDLRNVETQETREGGTKRIRLSLVYQSFYAALDARDMEVPGFTLTVGSDRAGGVTSAKAEVPPWSLIVSPLRQVQPPPRENPIDYMRPDGRVTSLEAGPAWRWAAIFAALALLAALLLAWDRAWGPFGARRGRPFAAVARTLRGLSRRSGEEGAYRDMLLALHRGLDATDGRRVLADDLPAFLDRHPAYRGEQTGLAQFFTASRLAFFGRETDAARSRWPFAEGESIARRLAVAERSA